MKKFLVVIDMQNKFIKDCNAQKLIAPIVEKIEQRKCEGYEILLTFDRAGGAMNEKIQNLCKDFKTYKKHTYGCKKLILDLKKANPDVVEFVGICTDICVITNVLGTMVFLPFSKLVVDEKCCCSKGAGHKRALSVMQACGVTIL